MLVSITIIFSIVIGGVVGSGGDWVVMRSFSTSNCSGSPFHVQSFRVGRCCTRWSGQKIRVDCDPATNQTPQSINQYPSSDAECSRGGFPDTNFEQQLSNSSTATATNGYRFDGVCRVKTYGGSYSTLTVETPPEPAPGDVVFRSYTNRPDCSSITVEEDPCYQSHHPNAVCGLGAFWTCDPSTRTVVQYQNTQGTSCPSSSPQSSTFSIVARHAYGECTTTTMTNGPGTWHCAPDVTSLNTLTAATCSAVAANGMHVSSQASSSNSDVDCFVISMIMIAVALVMFCFAFV
jgi:hypothetical protein